MSAQIEQSCCTCCQIDKKSSDDWIGACVNTLTLNREDWLAAHQYARPLQPLLAADYCQSAKCVSKHAIIRSSRRAEACFSDAMLMCAAGLSIDQHPPEYHPVSGISKCLVASLHVPGRPIHLLFGMRRPASAFRQKEG